MQNTTQKMIVGKLAAAHKENRLAFLDNIPHPCKRNGFHRIYKTIPHIEGTPNKQQKHEISIRHCLDVGQTS